MEEKIPVYSVCQNGDVYGISLVDKPANGFMFVALSDQSKLAKFVNLSEDIKKKRILYSIVLRPNQLIYREFENGMPYNLTFNEETVEFYSQEFLKKGFTNHSKYNHKGSWLDGVSIVESWIVNDPKNDKANAIGLSVEKSDWIAGIKVSQEVWDQYVETGKVTGFSIDSFISFDKINMSDMAQSKRVEHFSSNSVKEIKPNMSILKKIIKMFAEDSSNPVQEFETDKGKVYAEKLDLEYLVVYADGATFVGEFVFEDNKYTTDDQGVIIAIDAVEPEAEAEASAEQLMKATVKLSEVEKLNVDLKESNEIMKSTIDLLKNEMKAVEAEKQELKNEMKAVEAEKQELKAENIKLKALPMAEKLKGASNEDVNKTKVTQLSAIENLVNKNKK